MSEATARGSVDVAGSNLIGYSLQTSSSPLLLTSLDSGESHRLLVPFVIARIFGASTTGILLEERMSATNVPPGRHPVRQTMHIPLVFFLYCIATVHVRICLSS